MSRFILSGILSTFIVGFLLTSVMGCSSVPGTAQGETSGTQSGHTISSANDGKILARLLSVDSVTVVVGRNALDHFHNSKIKDYAQSLIVYHQQDYDHLKAVESDQNITPAEPDAYKSEQRVNHALQTLNSASTSNSYDLAYLKMQIRDQQAEIDALTKLQAAATNDHVRKELKNVLPTVKNDLNRAKTLLKGLGEQA